MKYTMAGLALLMLLAFQNCAPKEFSNSGEGSVSLSSLEGEDSASPESGEIDASGTAPEIAAPPVLVFPSIQLRIPRCTENQTCNVRVILNRTDARSVSFQWRTFDERARQDPQVYGQPNIHYVPVQGQVNLTPGQTQALMPIQFLNGFISIKVPFQWWDCRYDGKPVACEVYKFTLVNE